MVDDGVRPLGFAGVVSSLALAAERRVTRKAAGREPFIVSILYCAALLLMSSSFASAGIGRIEMAKSKGNTRVIHNAASFVKLCMSGVGETWMGRSGGGSLLATSRRVTLPPSMAPQ